MKLMLMLICTGFVLFFFSSCSPRAVQETFWAANTSVALDEEKKGNIETAETELRVALARAERELDDEKIASSLFNLGSFYRRQEQLPKAFEFLKEALILKENLFGPESQQAGRVLAELSAAYVMEGNVFEGRQYANRLKPLSSYYSGDEAIFVQSVMDAYVIDIEKYKNDVARLKTLADKNDPEAQYQLASVYFDGPDAKELFPQIMSLYESSAQLGYTDSQYYLGVIYDKGRGVDKNDEKARGWYKLAAENNHAIGQFNFAVFLMQGRGGEKNEDEAWSWMRKSGSQGYAAAQNILKKNNR